jgi:hypothetical protein
VAAGRGDVRATLFVGVYVFLTVNPQAAIVRDSVLSAAVMGNASRNSANVASGPADQRGQPLFLRW